MTGHQQDKQEKQDSLQRHIHQLEEDLRFFKNAVESSSDAIGMSTAEGKHFYQNQAFSDLFGDIDTESPIQTYVDRDIGREVFDTIMAGYPWTGEVKMYSHSGQILDILLRAYPHKDSEGNVRFLVGVHMDITRHKQTLDELLVSEKRFRSVVNSSPMGIYMYHLREDDELVFIGANESADRITGVGHEKFMGKTIKEAFPGLVETEVPKRYREAAKNGTPWHTEQVDYDEGGIRGAYEVFAFQTEPNRMACIFQDITERKQTEEAIAAERERLAVTLRSIGDGVITTDTEGNVVLINRVAETLTGWSQADARGKPITEVYSTINELTRENCPNPIRKVLGTGTGSESSGHTLLVAGDGTERIIAESGAPISNTAGETIGVVLTFRDMTEKQRLMDQIQKNQKIESLGVLAGGIAHDFNNLLAGIFGFINLAMDTARNPEVHSYLEKAMRAFERGQGLTQQLLTFSQGGNPIKRTGHLFPLVRENVQFALSGSNIAVEFDVAENLLPAEFDRNQIGQVVDNIVRNAQQAMPKGGTIIIRAENVSFQAGQHPSLPAGKYIHLSIRDHGIGIPANIISDIFDPFFTTKEHGHGLGLATCYSIIARHGGSLSVESEPVEGSVFHIHLPATDKEVSETPDPIKRTATSGARILVMDDEEMLREMVSQMLESMGHTVTTACNGTEAVEQFRSAMEGGSPFDLLLLDLTVPGGDGGKKAAVKIRKLDRNVPILVSSGYASDSVISSPNEHGFSGSIMKPFTMNELAGQIEKHLK